MAQQSARRDRDNQAATPYFEYATLIWTRSANSHAGRRSMAAQRPDRWQHPTTRHGIPDVFPCPEGGVHRWLARMLARKPRMLVTTALANKMARIVWALLVKGGTYRVPAVAA